MSYQLTRSRAHVGSTHSLDLFFCGLFFVLLSACSDQGHSQRVASAPTVTPTHQYRQVVVNPTFTPASTAYSPPPTAPVANSSRYGAANVYPISAGSVSDFLVLQRQDRSIRAKSDPNIKPSQVPPAFKHEPWKNRIPLLEDTSLGVFTSNFGWRRLSGKANFHNGVDIWVKPGTRIISPATGQVVLAKSSGKQSEIVIRQGPLLITLLHVVPDPSIVEGSQVRLSQPIGSQSTYNHFEYAIYYVPSGALSQRDRQTAINPLYLHELGSIN